MKTEIIAILDRSGSMRPIIDEAVGGFNKFLADQKAVPGEARMTVVSFDNIVESLYEGKPLAEAPELKVEDVFPRGMTALNDAIGMTLNKHKQRIGFEAWADATIVCIVTDGEENASKEYTIAQVKELVKSLETQGWKFVFLAANQDAWTTSARYGLDANNAAVMDFAATKEDTLRGYATASASVASMRTGGKVGG